MSEKVKQAIDYCTRNGQAQLADYLKPVFAASSDRLAREILRIDLPGIEKLYAAVSSKDEIVQPDTALLEPLRSTVLSELDDVDRSELARLGDAWIASGRIAALTMAGGQGTRLGHSGPKGTFVLPLDPPVSLFQIQCEGLQRVGARNGVVIPWFIMTSAENHADTVAYFQEHRFFGYDPDRIWFFPQEMVPVVDFEGKLLIKDHHIVAAANGNGGVFSSLASSGNLERMEQMGIEKVFVCGIDNARIRMADPVFVGFAEQSGKPLVSKSVYKRSPDEKAGVFCRRNGRPGYVEYTEISPEQAASTDADGRLLFGDAGIVAYVYDVALLRRLAVTPLPYHAARKKVPYDRPDGTLVEPDQPNAIKFETFIFDSFDAAEDIAVLRVDRHQEFAPIKNRTGEDSPESLAAEAGGIPS